VGFPLPLLPQNNDVCSTNVGTGFPLSWIELMRRTREDDV
jgi:hypothetical protein